MGISLVLLHYVKIVIINQLLQKLGRVRMLIQCTKKLLAELKTAPSPSTNENPLYSWHANILTLNRRKTLVLMNDSNRYVIVLYGLKAKDMKKIDTLILQAITETFQSEGIKDEVIEALISQSKEFSFTTTKDRTMVARLNKACENVEYFWDDYLNEDSINQTALNKWVSRLLFGNGKKDYIVPTEELIKDMKQLSGGQPFHSEAFVLHIKLNLENHDIWRRVVVPKHITFPELHKTIQRSFGWQNSHLHEFNIYQSRPKSLEKGKQSDDRKPIVNLVCHQEALGYDHGIPMKLETNEKLQDYLPAEIEYIYDFGDNWEHEVVVENIIDNYEWNYPVCLAGEGNTPPEDVGGEGGFEVFLEILADPSHPDYKFMKNWGSQQRYREFDIKTVNWDLKKI
jgi:hypothetical protein